MRATLRDQFEQASAGMIVFLMQFQMAGQFVDPFGQERDLHLGRAGVGLTFPAFLNDILLFLGR